MSVMPARSLVMNGAGAGRGQSNLIALLEGERCVASQIMAGRGAAEKFAPTVQALLETAGWTQPPELVAAIIGPGSFTGLRASLALASGLVRGWGCQCAGVRLGDAVRATVQRADLTVMCLARRGRIFVDPAEGEPYALAVTDAQERSWPALAGDAVSGVDHVAEFSHWHEAHRGPEIVDCPAPSAVGILKAALSAETYPLTPLYIDPPEAKLPAGGLRPAPQR